MSSGFVYPGSYYWPNCVASSVLMAVSTHSFPLQTGRRKAREKARSEDSVYVISFPEKFQTHSNHFLIKSHISPINRYGLPSFYFPEKWSHLPKFNQEYMADRDLGYRLAERVTYLHAISFFSTRLAVTHGLRITGHCL